MPSALPPAVALPRLTWAAVSLLTASLLAGCPQQTSTSSPTPTPKSSGKDPYAKPASQPGHGAASQPADDKKAQRRAKAKSDAAYKEDGADIPKRPGVHRIFMQLGGIKYVRDVTTDPVSGDYIVAAQQSGIDGMWRIPADGKSPAERIAVKPLRDAKGKPSPKNRSNWFFSTPSVFPDGKNVIFGGVSASPKQRYANTMGISGIKEGGFINAVVVKDVTYVATPNLHPDGKTVVFASCEEIRTTTLSGRGDQEVESVVVARIPRTKYATNPAVCTVFRPRFSPDGKRIVFEGIGAHFSEEARNEFKLPEKQNNADFFIEPYVVDADGKNLHKLVDLDTWNSIGGRVRPGGAHAPLFSKDGTSVYFAHGKAIAKVSIDGKTAEMLTHSPVVGGEKGMRWNDDHPTLTKDGKLVAVSRLLGSTTPIGLAIIDPTQTDPRTPQEQAGKAPPAPIPPEGHR